MSRRTCGKALGNSQVINLILRDKAEQSVRCWDAALSNPNLALMQGLRVGRDYRVRQAILH